MIAKNGPLRRSTDSLQRRAATRPFQDVVEELLNGPPVPVPVLREAADLHEFFVHFEDVRRAHGQLPRADPELDEALWNLVPLFGRFLTREAKGLEITLVTPFGRRRQVRTGDHWVEARGRAQELFLWLHNRPGDVEVVGDEEGLAQLESIRLGM